jgi:mitogen-activated protein kinase kinase kinase
LQLVSISHVTCRNLAIPSCIAHHILSTVSRILLRSQGHKQSSISPMEPAPRGVRFQDFPHGDIEEDLPQPNSPAPRTMNNPNASPRPLSTLPNQTQQNSRPTYGFAMDPPIDYGVPSLVEEGGFPFETPSTNVSGGGYAWTPISPSASQPTYFTNGQYYSAYDQEQFIEDDRSTERNRVRPGTQRIPSNSYIPIRHSDGQHDQYASSSTRRGAARFLRSNRIRPNRANYLAKMQSDPDDDYLQHSSVGYRRDVELDSDDASDANELREYDNEFDDLDRDLMSAPGIDLTPSAEDLLNPEYIERIEWHNRLSQVLSGDVVTSEKKRISEPSGPEDEKAHRYDLWLGIRAKAYGRSIADQIRFLVEGRAYIDRVIEDVLSFSVKSFEDGDEASKTPEQQVDEILARWDRCEALYPSCSALMEDKPATAEGSEFDTTLSALIAWSNVTKSVHTSLQILRAWTGQEDLDLARRGTAMSKKVDTGGPNIKDESSFIERILKENRIDQTFSKAILSTLSKQVYKAKEAVEQNHSIFERMRLPSFLGDVQLLVNFPTKLIEEALKIRLAYAKKLREPGLIVMEQLIDDFALCMKVAVGIKKEYLIITAPSDGWNLVSWVDDSVRSIQFDLTKV